MIRPSQSRPQKTSNADFISLLMFVPEYLQRLIAMGAADAEARLEAIEKVAKRPARQTAPAGEPEPANVAAEPVAPENQEEEIMNKAENSRRTT